MQSLRLALLSTVCLLPAMVGPVFAETAGVTAAVNQSALGTPPGAAVRTIVLGENIVQDERIDTSGEGLVQILLADGTTFTVGPNSSLTIDRFVYDPAAGTAEVTASLTRGVFRFIGGRTSKTEGGVTVNTPVGTIGIRGAVVDLSLFPSGQQIKAQFDLLFGKEVTLKPAGGGSERIYKPGYSIIVGSDGATRIAKTPPGWTNQIQQALTGKAGTDGGAEQVPNNQNVADSGISDTNSGANNTSNTLPPPTNTNPGGIIVEQAVGDALRLLIEENAEQPFSGVYQGFSTGFVAVEYEGSGGIYYDAVASLTPGETVIDFDPDGESLGGNFLLHEVLPYSGTSEFEFAFGNGSTGDSSTIVDNENFSGAGGYQSVTAEGYSGDGGTGSVVTSGAASSIAAHAPCVCAFLQWDTWQSNVTDGSYDITGHGLWVTGDIPGNAEFDAGAALLGSATYNGKAIGELDSGLVASGDMEMSFDFDSRDGEMIITDFNGADFGAGLVGFGPSGPLFVGAGESPDGGLVVNGAFVNDGPDVAAGVIGNFGMVTEGWQAIGIFAGER